MDTPWASLLSRKLILVTGKGGIGKTTAAVAIALQGAASGRRVLLVESSAHDQLSPSFGLAPCGHSETEVAPGLKVINLNARENFREYIVKYLGLGHTFEMVFGHQIVTSFIETIPGLAELILLGRLFYSAKLKTDDPYDLVVFDGPAFGHFFSLMTTPQAVADGGIIGPVRNESDRIRAFLSDEVQSATVLVTTCDELSVNECSEFLPKIIEKSPSKVLAIIANRLLLPLSAESSERKNQLLALPREGADFLQKRFDRQDLALRDVCQLGQRNKISVLGIRDLGAMPSNMSEEWMSFGLVGSSICS